MSLNLDKRVAVLGIARMADALGNSFLIVVLPLYIASGSVTGETFGLTQSLVTGIVLALFGLVNSATQPFAGRFSDRAGKRKLFVVVGLVILGFSNYAFSLMDSYLGVLLVRAVQGFAAALTITATVALVNELSVTGNRGRNMGTFNSFRLVGFGVGPLLGGVVVEGGPYSLPVAGGMQISGFEASFYAAALAALISVVLVTLFVEDPEETQPTTEKLAIAVRAQDLDHVLDPIFTLGLATLAMAGSIALLAPIEPAVNVRLDQDAVLFGVQFAAFIGAMALTQPLVGSASDRYGRRRFIIAGLVFLIPTTLAQGLVTTSTQMIVARLLQGISGAMIFAPALALAGDLARQGQSGAQLSVVTVAWGFGISFGQLASGFLIRYAFVTPFLFGAVIAALGAVLVHTQVEETVPHEFVMIGDSR
jgi:MFS family permease